MFRSRVVAIAASTTLLFGVVVCRLACVQLIRGPEFEALAVKRRIGAEDLRAHRGRILDRHGSPLAYDVPGFDLHCRVGYLIRGSVLGAVHWTHVLFDRADGREVAERRFCRPDLEIESLRSSDLETIGKPDWKEEAREILRSLLVSVSSNGGGVRRASVDSRPADEIPLGESLTDSGRRILREQLASGATVGERWADGVRLLALMRRPTFGQILENPALSVEPLLRVTSAEVAAIADRTFRSECVSLFANLAGTDRDRVLAVLKTATEPSFLLVALAGSVNEARQRVLEGLARDADRLRGIAVAAGVELSTFLEGLDDVWLRAETRVRSRVGRFLLEDPDANPREVANVWRQYFRDYPFRSERLFRGIPFEGVLTVFESALPGLTVEERAHREVRSREAFHVVGWTGLVTRGELDEMSSRREELRGLTVDGGLPLLAKLELDRLEEGRLRQDDIVGRAGVEQRLEGALRGRHGYQKVLRDRRGRPIEVVEERKPSAGHDVTLTLDMGLQSRAIEVLDGRKGAVIILEVATGQVLCLASSPSLVYSDFRERYRELASDTDQPLINRACRIPKGVYPGSTFKVVLATAGLEEGIITEESTFHCRGSLRPGQVHSFRCLGHHGDIALRRAMARSCNVYFYKLGEALGSERIAEWGRKFGFGSECGIELLEDGGYIHSKKTSPAPWGKGDTWHVSIGQKQVVVTPLQVAVMVSIIAQDGISIRPTLVRKVGEEATPPPERRVVAISDETLRLLQESLEEVVVSGTAADTGLSAFGAAGKTGTAQVGGELPDETWFVGYAPAASPRIVVCVFLEDTLGSTAETVVPIAREMMAAYFGEKEGGGEG